MILCDFGIEQFSGRLEIRLLPPGKHQDVFRLQPQIWRGVVMGVASKYRDDRDFCLLAQFEIVDPALIGPTSPGYAQPLYDWRRTAIFRLSRMGAAEYLGQRLAFAA